MEGAEPHLDTVVYFLHQEVPEISVRKEYPPGIDPEENPERYLLRLHHGTKHLGWIASRRHTHYDGNPVAQRRPFENEEEADMWRRVNLAYDKSWLYSLLETPSRSIPAEPVEAIA